MAAIRGEIRVPCNGRIWVICLDFNALCAFEEVTGRPALEVLAAVEEGAVVRMNDLRQMIHCALLRHQPGATLLDAGDVLQAAPEALAEAMAAAAPPAPDVPPPDGEGPAKKTRARARRA
ncbi:hypothetical protein [Halodurantibacterium flavum]|uniref:Uncharacterized protein n=1 Tax=Halodurantibacterium flavum TaxID=1382802 RepID=A0ABW4S880_9RHOB